METPDRYQYAGKRSVMRAKAGASIITLPKHIIVNEGVKKGDTVAIFSDGQGHILIDLRPGE